MRNWGSCPQPVSQPSVLGTSRAGAGHPTIQGQGKVSLWDSPPAAPLGSEVSGRTPQAVASSAVHRGSTGPALRPERGVGQFPEQDRAQVSQTFVCIRALPRGCGHPNLGTPRSSLGNHSARWRVQAPEQWGQRNPDSLVPRVSSKCSWRVGTSVWIPACGARPPPQPGLRQKGRPALLPAPWAA